MAYLILQKTLKQIRDAVNEEPKKHDKKMKLFSLTYWFFKERNHHYFFLFSNNWTFFGSKEWFHKLLIIWNSFFFFNVLLLNFQRLQCSFLKFITASIRGVEKSVESLVKFLLEMFTIFSIQYSSYSRDISTFRFENVTKNC